MTLIRPGEVFIEDPLPPAVAYRYDEIAGLGTVVSVETMCPRKCGNVFVADDIARLRGFLGDHLRVARCKERAADAVDRRNRGYKVEPAVTTRQLKKQWKTHDWEGKAV